MKSALVITRIAALGLSWQRALEDDGWRVFRSEDLADAGRVRRTPVDILIVDVEHKVDRVQLTRLCATRDLPPVIVHASPRVARSLPTRLAVATMHVGALTPEMVVRSAAAVLEAGGSERAVLPFRVPTLQVLKWTVLCHARRAATLT